ncbi:component of SufBCD complex [Roseovarius sp. C7]|uniref:component of SufBCD complex n=1 Tax=Roseovarius sp. C7 TaxID=3398643 RepID=UPI0039F4E731
MDWYTAVFELIDMRSFSNLWFWIALAVMWSTVNHWVLGVPYDMILRARRAKGETDQDFEDLVRINVNRILLIAEESGVLLVGFASFLLSALVLLGFVYDREFAQALVLLGAPMTLVTWLVMRTAKVIRVRDLHGPELVKRLSRHRVMTQVIGIISLFVTALWGMLQNFSSSALGG